MFGFQISSTLNAAMTDSADGASTAFPGLAAGRALGARLHISRWAGMSRQLWMLGVTLLALLLTLLLQTLSLTVHTLAAHTAVVTAAGMIGALAVAVLAERVRVTHQLRDFLIAMSLAILSATDLSLGAGPSLLDLSPGRSWQWTALIARLAAGGILIGAAFAPDAELVSTRHAARRILAVSLGILALAAASMLALSSQLPSLLIYPGSTASSYPQMLGALLVSGAAFGLARHAARVGSAFERWLAAAVIVLAVARLNYLLVPSLNSGQRYSGDIVELLAYMLILYACLLEFRGAQRNLATRVAVAERRRMARDMHDGLAQELAFIATHSQRLGRTGDDAVTVAHLRAAAERALHDSRTTIAVLTSADDAPIDLLITRTVESFRSRFGVTVELDLERGVVVDAERRNSLLRILHEALTNAIRHGSAGRVLVRLSAGQDGLVLSIADDGCGFDVASAVTPDGGLGLTSMSERAQLLGGALSVLSTPATGTTVEVVLP